MLPSLRAAAAVGCYLVFRGRAEGAVRGGEGGGGRVNWWLLNWRYKPVRLNRDSVSKRDLPPPPVIGLAVAWLASSQQPGGGQVGSRTWTLIYVSCPGWDTESGQLGQVWGWRMDRKCSMDGWCSFPATGSYHRLEGLRLMHLLCWAKERWKMKEDPLNGVKATPMVCVQLVFD